MSVENFGRASLDSSVTYASTSATPVVVAVGQHSHSISSLLASPVAAPLFSSAAFTQLNPLRQSTGRTTTTRGKPAEAIKLSDLATVQKSAFDSYLANLKPEHERYLAATSEEKGKGRAAKEHILPLDTVPEIYLSEDFDLTLPRTFDAITEGDDAVADRLTSYLDVVEQHLSKEIAHRSHSFFSALSNLQQLHAQSTVALQRAGSLKQELVSIDEQTAKKGLEIIRHSKKRRRTQEIIATVERVKELQKAVDDAAELAEHGDWEDALSIIEEVEKAWSASETIQFDRIKALQHIPSKLKTLRTSIGRSLQAEFVAVLAHQLSSQTQAHLDLQSDWNKEKADEKASDVVRPFTRGLLRCGPSNVDTALHEWKEAVLTDVRQSIRSNLPASADLSLAADEDDDANMAAKSAALAKNIKALSHSKFMETAKTIYSRLLATVEVVQLHATILVDQLQPLDAEEGTRQYETETQEIIHAAAELGNARFAKVLAIRADLHTNLPLEEFVDLFASTWAFVLACEVACKRMIVGLRGVIIGQAKTWLQAFHQRKISENAKIVEEEQWTVADVSAADQHHVTLIIDGAITDPPELKLERRLQPGQQANGKVKGSSSKQVEIDDRTFFAVPACLACIDSLLDYIRVIINIPLLTTECMGRTIEFLKQFNSRTCQVVLGAGAMRSAGLKNITARHLALASQCLSILINLIPYVRELLRRHLNVKQAVMLVDFDKLKRDYQEHQNEIYSKLVSIMGDRLTVHCKSLHGIDWSTVSDPGRGAQPYLEALVKETTTLHKVLAKYMPGQPLELVMMQVLSAITSKLASEFASVALPDARAKTKLLKDAKYLRIKLMDLKGLESAIPGGDIEELVQGRVTQADLRARLEAETAAHKAAEIAKEPAKVQLEIPPAPTVLEPADADRQAKTPSPMLPESDDLNPQPSSVRNRLGALFKGPISMRRTPSGGTIADARSSIDLPPPRESIDSVRTDDDSVRESMDLSRPSIDGDISIDVTLPLAPVAGTEDVVPPTSDKHPVPAEETAAEELHEESIEESTPGTMINGDLSIRDDSSDKQAVVEAVGSTLAPDSTVPAEEDDESQPTQVFERSRPYLAPLQLIRSNDGSSRPLSEISSTDDLPLMTAESTVLQDQTEDIFKTPPTAPTSEFVSPVTPKAPRSRPSLELKMPKEPEAPTSLSPIKLAFDGMPQMASNLNVKSRLGALFQKSGSVLRRTPSGTSWIESARAISNQFSPRSEFAPVSLHARGSSIDSIDYDQPPLMGLNGYFGPPSPRITEVPPTPYKTANKAEVEPQLVNNSRPEEIHGDPVVAATATDGNQDKQDNVAVHNDQTSGDQAVQ